MVTRAETIDWVAARSFTAYAIDIRECAWCGNGFVRLRIDCKPHIFCSEECRKENGVTALKEWQSVERLTRRKKRG